MTISFDWQPRISSIHHAKNTLKLVLAFSGVKINGFLDLRLKSTRLKAEIGPS